MTHPGMGSEDFYSLQRAGYDQLLDNSWIGWHQGEIFKHHQPSGFNQSTVYVLAVSTFYLVRGLLPGKKQFRSQAFICIFQGTGSSVILPCGRIIV